jgi:hypothetical protein
MIRRELEWDCIHPTLHDLAIRSLKSELTRIAVVESDEPLVDEIIDGRKRSPGLTADFLPDLSIRGTESAGEQDSISDHRPDCGETRDWAQRKSFARQLGIFLWFGHPRQCFDASDAH